MSTPSRVDRVQSNLLLLLLTTAVSVSAATLVCALIWAMEAIGFFVGTNQGSFESMHTWQLVAMLLSGYLILLLLNALLHVDGREVGVVHTLYSIGTQQAKLPARNALMQMGGMVAVLSTGFIGGREGPAVHMGAWLGSTLSQWFKANDNVRLHLVHAGLVAAVAAGLNTTFAAVCFVIEVVRAPAHTIRSVALLVFAAVVGTLVAEVLGINQFTIQASFSGYFPTLDWMLLLATGIALGIVAVLFQLILVTANRLEAPFWIRMGGLTLLTCFVAVYFPQVLGIGFDSIVLVESGEFNQEIILLLSLALLRITLSAMGIGLGLPVGIIGPCFVNGALLGAVCYLAFQLLVPEWVTVPIEIYLLLGAAVLLGCTINTPITVALLFFELTHNILASLQVVLVISVAYLCKITISGKHSAFEARLANQGIQVRELLR